MGLVRYCRPSDIITALGTPSGPAAATGFPVTRVADGFVEYAYKAAAGTGGTITITFGSPKTVVAVALGHHNFAGATVSVTNGAGLNQPMPIPATPLDGLPLDPWLSLAGLANTSSTTWNLVVSGAAGPIALGELILVETLRTLDLRLGSVGQGEEHAGILRPTDHGVRNKISLDVRQRAYRGTAVTEAQRADIEALGRDSRGLLKNFLLIPDDAVNDALFVDLTTRGREWRFRDENITEIDLQFTEQQKGLAL